MQLQMLRSLQTQEARRLMGLFDPDDEITAIGRMPKCVWPIDVKERVAIAEKAFRERYPKITSVAARTAGCEDDGQLIVGLMSREGYLSVVTNATYSVARTTGKAKYLGAGIARAHVDLDGDGRRDIVWAVPELIDTMDFHITRTRFEAQLTSGRRVKTEPYWEEPSGHEAGHVKETGGVPELASAFVLVIGGGIGLMGDGGITTRMRWDGKGFLKEDRIFAEDFDTRVDQAREKEQALDLSAFKPELERCSQITESDAACIAMSLDAQSRLVRGGLSKANAEETLRDFLGWPCPTK